MVPRSRWCRLYSSSPSAATWNCRSYVQTRSLVCPEFCFGHQVGIGYLLEMWVLHTRDTEGASSPHHVENKRGQTCPQCLDPFGTVWWAYWEGGRGREAVKLR